MMFLLLHHGNFRTLLILLMSIQTIHGFVGGIQCQNQRFSLARPSRISSSSLLLHAHQHYQYLATCLPGLASVVEKEIQDVVPNAYKIQTSGTAAVQFQGDSVKVGLAALLYTRATHKVMEFLGSHDHVNSREDVYHFIQNHADVKQLLGDGKGGLLTLSVHVVLTNSRNVPSDINHSHFTALTIKNALVDAVREMRNGERPNVDIESAEVPLVAVVRGSSISLYRQLHNGSLHRRGYRSSQQMHKASMKESMAAGLLLGTEYDFDNAQELTIVDPMAGSGSLILEACMILGQVAPGLMRIKCGVPGSNCPPVVKWKNEDENVGEIWKELLVDATKKAKNGLSKLRSSNKVKIVANEIHPGAIDLLEESLQKAGFMDLVEIYQGDCQDFVLPTSTERCLVVTNPPWGIRLTQDMHESWEALRVFLRENCPPGTEAWVLSGNKEATKHLGLRRSQSIVLQTGQQDLRWIQYKILDKSEQRIRSKNDGKEKRPPRKSREQATIPSGNPTRARHSSPPKSSPTRNGNKLQAKNRGGYERRNMNHSNDKSVSKPLTTAERKERKNSWYI